MKILLHICCAGCAIYTFKTLEKKFDKVTGFFFNPNIQPYTEFRSREEALEKYALTHDKEVIYEAYRPERFFREVNHKESKGLRCPICWSTRLLEAANFAKENGFDAFTTTLLISPHQDHMLIKEIGEDISGERGVSFYYEDFREGFKESIEALKNAGLYSQKYCGCVYSEQERFENIKKDGPKLCRQ